jgi:PD-(D/E)XK endonuclease
VPFGENARYDLVIDDGTTLAKVQCKTGRLRAGAVRWNVCSNYFHHPNPRFRSRDYHGQVDYFGIYCRETSAVYLVPMEHLGLVRATASLRVQAAKNGQQKLIRHARQYEIGRVQMHTPDSCGT